MILAPDWIAALCVNLSTHLHRSFSFVPPSFNKIAIKIKTFLYKIVDSNSKYNIKLPHTNVSKGKVGSIETISRKTVLKLTNEEEEEQHLQRPPPHVILNTKRKFPSLVVCE